MMMSRGRVEVGKKSKELHKGKVKTAAAVL